LYNGSRPQYLATSEISLSENLNLVVKNFEMWFWILPSLFTQKSVNEFLNTEKYSRVERTKEQ